MVIFVGLALAWDGELAKNREALRSSRFRLISMGGALRITYFLYLVSLIFVQNLGKFQSVHNFQSSCPNLMLLSWPIFFFFYEVFVNISFPLSGARKHSCEKILLNVTYYFAKTHQVMIFLFISCSQRVISESEQKNWVLVKIGWLLRISSYLFKNCIGTNCLCVDVLLGGVDCCFLETSHRG